MVLPTQQAGSLALLVSECVSNAVKHGQGDITISLSVRGATAHLEICDSGPGFPTDFNPEQSAHTGLQLIESIARWDLRGDVRYDNDPSGGGRVTVTFPATLPEGGGSLPNGLPPRLTAIE